MKYNKLDVVTQVFLDGLVIVTAEIDGLRWMKIELNFYSN